MDPLDSHYEDRDLNICFKTDEIRFIVILKGLSRTKELADDIFQNEILYNDQCKSCKGQMSYF